MIRELHFSARMIGRTGGRSPVSAAAYRSGERLRDERQARTWNYKRRQAIAAKGIMTPEGAPEWAADRARLWNEVDRAEKRADAQTAREVVLGLPHELTEGANEALLRDFIHREFVARGMVADYALHRPDAKNDARNVHAHVMLTTREIDASGFGKKVRAWNSPDLLRHWREEWAATQNRGLDAQGHRVRVEHRSFKDRGLDRKPTVHLGPRVAGMEKRGEPAKRSHGQVRKAGPWVGAGKRRSPRVMDFGAIAAMSRAELNRSRTVDATSRYGIAADRMAAWFRQTFTGADAARETFIRVCLSHGLNHALRTAESDPEQFGALRSKAPQKRAQEAAQAHSRPTPSTPDRAGEGTAPRPRVAGADRREGEDMAKPPRKDRDQGARVVESYSVTVDLTAMAKETEAPKRGLFDTKHARHVRAALWLRPLFIQQFGRDHESAMRRFVEVADYRGFPHAADRLRHEPSRLGRPLPTAQDLTKRGQKARERWEAKEAKAQARDAARDQAKPDKAAWAAHNAKAERMAREEDTKEAREAAFRRETEADAAAQARAARMQEAARGKGRPRQADPLADLAKRRQAQGKGRDTDRLARAEQARQKERERDRDR